MIKYYTNPFLNFLNFKGRASLKEFWSFALINFCIGLILILTKKIHHIDNLYLYYRYIYIIPTISLGFRRIQDTGKSGWLFLIPGVNLLLSLFNGEESPNRYGNPIND